MTLLLLIEKARAPDDDPKAQGQSDRRGHAGAEKEPGEQAYVAREIAEARMGEMADEHVAEQGRQTGEGTDGIGPERDVRQPEEIAGGRKGHHRGNPH